MLQKSCVFYYRTGVVVGNGRIGKPEIYQAKINLGNFYRNLLRQEAMSGGTQAVRRASK